MPRTPLQHPITPSVPSGTSSQPATPASYAEVRSQFDDVMTRTQLALSFTEPGLLSKNQLNWKPLVECGALINLIACMTPATGAVTTDWGLQRASMIALFELAYSTPDVKHTLVELGALGKLVGLLKTSTSKDIK